MKNVPMYRLVATILCLLAAAPAGAQDRFEQDGPAPSSPVTTAPGRVADAGAGEIGQRQTREQAGPNVNPLQRIDSRLANRVQTRIRSRIDADYDPQTNVTSPFRTASDQARTASRPRRR